MRVSVPKSLDAALGLLAEDPQAVVLAGGTDLMVAINFGRARPEHIVSIARLAELKELVAGEQGLCGAGVTYTHLLQRVRDRALVDAARTVGSPQIRNAGTIGGNLGTCSPAGDTLPILAALDATIVVVSRRSGERRVPFSDWMRGPKQPALEPGELVLRAEWEEAGPAQAFLKAGTRNAMVIAVASLAMVVDRARRRVRVALGSAGPTIIRATAAEEMASGLIEEVGWERPLTLTEAARARFGELVAAAARPIDDQRGTGAYRRHVIGVMASRALQRTGAAA